MSKCLRCGAGNEWIEPVGKGAMTAKRKRPKVRYVAIMRAIYSKKKNGDLELYIEGDYYVPFGAMRRIAAALNLHESVRRGEM